MTLPKRTDANRVAAGPLYSSALDMSRSASSFVAPITFVGSTALSVLTVSTRSTPASIAASTTFCVPRTFVSVASKGLNSQAGTCFMAAACTTTSMPLIARAIRSRLRTSPISIRSAGISRSSWASSNCLVSSRDSTRRARGCSAMMRRTISLPMEPVPPVTRTVRPRK